MDADSNYNPGLDLRVAAVAPAVFLHQAEVNVEEPLYGQRQLDGLVRGSRPHDLPRGFGKERKRHPIFF